MHFHVHTGNSIEYDCEGAHFDNVEMAKAFGLQLFRNYFLFHPRPRPEILEKSILCITDPYGAIEPVPFLEASAFTTSIRSSTARPATPSSHGEAPRVGTELR